MILLTSTIISVDSIVVFTNNISITTIIYFISVVTTIYEHHYLILNHLYFTAPAPRCK